MKRKLLAVALALASLAPGKPFKFNWCPYAPGCRYEVQWCRLVVPPVLNVTNAPLAYPDGSWQFYGFLLTNFCAADATNPAACYRVRINDPAFGVGDWYSTRACGSDTPHPSIPPAR